MIIRKVRDRGDDTKVVTIPKDSDIEPGDYVKLFKIPETEPGNNYSENVLEEARNQLEQVRNGDADLHDLEEILQQAGGTQ